MLNSILKSKRVRGAAVVVAAMLALSACTNEQVDQANTAERAASGSSLATFLEAQPVPYDWSQIRETLISIEGAQASTVQTTTFFFNQGMIDPYLVCNSIGFPVASTTQLTNPQQVQDQGTTAAAVIDQMDPTGVYTGNSEGTYVICVTPAGKATIQYAEPNVHTVGGPAKWDLVNHVLVVTGDPTVSVKVGKDDKVNKTNK